VENLVGEASERGWRQSRSKKFRHYAWFQLVMLSYNMWRYLKMLAQRSAQSTSIAASGTVPDPSQSIQDNTIRIARLKLLFIAAKTPFHDNHTTVKYSEQDIRTPMLMRLLEFLDEARKKTCAWLDGAWPCRFALNTA